MKLKFYLRGLGIGIILTTLILIISDNSRKLSDEEIIRRAIELGMVMKEDPKGNLDEVMEPSEAAVTGEPSPAVEQTGELTEEEPAEEQTMDSGQTDTVTEETSGEETSEEETSDEKTSKEETSEEETLEEQDVSDVTEPAESPDIGGEVDAPVTPAPTIQPAEKDNSDGASEQDVTFTINKGMSSRKVSIMLETKGLIDNAEKFNEYIMKEGKAGIIMIGKYSVPKGSSYETILDIITKR